MEIFKIIYQNIKYHITCTNNINYNYKYPNLCKNQKDKIRYNKEISKTNVSNICININIYNYNYF